jgi:hypothetical protein
MEDCNAKEKKLYSCSLDHSITSMEFHRIGSFPKEFRRKPNMRSILVESLLWEFAVSTIQTPLLNNSCSSVSYKIQKAPIMCSSYCCVPKSAYVDIVYYNIRSWLNLIIFCNLWFTWPWQKSILQQLHRSSKMLPVSSFFTSIYNHFIIFHKRALLDDNYYTRWATTLILREAHILCTEILFVTWQESFVAWSSFRLRSSRQR